MALQILIANMVSRDNETVSIDFNDEVGRLGSVKQARTFIGRGLSHHWAWKLDTSYGVEPTDGPATMVTFCTAEDKVK